jgi:anti-sigma regulatory factor (Ser/Thr protein kinase)
MLRTGQHEVHAQENDESQTGESAITKRGWGLSLIHALMDEVVFERVDDGTKLKMIKLLRK